MDATAPAKAKDAYRNYAEPGARHRARVLPPEPHAPDATTSSSPSRRDFLRFDRREMTPWDALDYLNTLVDDSDPDIALPQIDHLLQTGEAIRADGHPDWMVLTGFIHDLGKVLCLFGEPQWAVVGDTFPIGCPYSPQDRLPRVLRRSTRTSRRPEYQTGTGIYARRLRPRRRPDVLGPRRVPVPPGQGPPADCRRCT